MGSTTSAPVLPTDEAIVNASLPTLPQSPPPIQLEPNSLPPRIGPRDTRHSLGAVREPDVDPRTPLPPASVPVRPNPTPDLFLPLPPAFFSPSIPTPLIQAWTSHGGFLIPTSADLTRAHQRQYLNIPQSTITALADLLSANEGYVFVLPSDPLLHFTHHLDVFLLDPRWIEDCIEEERLLDIEGYRVERPAGAGDQAGEVQRMLDELVGGLRSPDRPIPANVPKHSGASPSVPELPRLCGTKRKAPGKKRYILQPYLELAIPSTQPKSRRSVATSSAYPPPLDQEAKNRYILQAQAGSSRPVNNSSPVPSVSLPDTATLDLPTFEFTLETDIAPGFRLDKLNEDQMAQLISEIVEDASRGMEGDLRYWDVEDKVGMEAEAEEEKEGVAERGEQKELVKAEEEGMVEALFGVGDQPKQEGGAVEEGRDRRKRKRRNVADYRPMYDPQDRPTPVTPTRNPIRAPLSPYHNLPVLSQPRTKGANRGAALDEKKENRGMGKSYGFGRHGPGTSTLALTTRNLQRQQASMDEEMMHEHQAVMRTAKRKTGDLMHEGSPTVRKNGARQPKGGEGMMKRPIWKDHMADRRFRTS